MYSNFNSNQNTFGYSFQNNQQYVGAPLVEQMFMAQQPVQQEWYGWSPERNVEGYIPVKQQEPVVYMQPSYTINNNYYYTNSGNTTTVTNSNCGNRKTDLSITFGQAVGAVGAAASLGLLAYKVFLDD